MIHPDHKKLLDFFNSDINITDMIDEEYEEIYNLETKRLEEIVSQIPHPECCQAMRDFKVIYPSLVCEEDKTSLEWKAEWNCGRNKNHGEPDYNMPKLNFCPFCGTELPGLVKKENVSPYIAIHELYNDNCLNCGENLICGKCYCDSIFSCYEIKKEGKK